MNDFEKATALLAANNGVITAMQITEATIPRRCLTEMVHSGKLYKVDRGIYALPDAWEDEMYFMQYRFKKGIFSHDTALYLHSLVDRTPMRYTMTFPNGYNNASLKKQSINAKYIILKNYDLGIEEVLSPSGNSLRVYNVERTLCDIVQKKYAGDIQMINQAMKSYVSLKTKDLSKLIDYAERLRVKASILNYMEVLL